MCGKLFQPAPVGRGKGNAIVGGIWASQYSYINGYYRAARTLAKSAVGQEPQDLLFYPICFNYRHYLELHLKGLIITAERFYVDLKDFGEAKGVLDRRVEGTMAQPKYHNLHRLLNLFEERLQLVTHESMDDEIRKAILELHETDNNGQVYRYHRRANKQASLPGEEHYDVANIAYKMEQVHNELMGMDLWISHNHDMLKSIMSDLSPQ